MAARYTPKRLIKRVHAVNGSTPLSKVEGLLLACFRMSRQNRQLPKRWRRAYSRGWEYVAIQAFRQKY